jgi:heme/copper-type cytochrome/quinol oxidase subunit 1
MYIIVGSIGASLGSAYSFLMRIELGIPGYVLLENNLHDYNVWITAHGVIMVFFMVMPIMIGALGNMIVPIQLGSPDMVFPRLNNLSF